MTSGTGSLKNRRIAQAAHRDVQNHCHKTGDTQQDVADALHIPLGTLSNYLCGHSPIPAEVIVRIGELTRECEALETMASMVDANVVKGGSIQDVAAAMVLASNAELDARNTLLMSMADGTITSTEYAQWEQAWTRLRAMNRQLRWVVKANVEFRATVGAARITNPVCDKF